MTSSDTQAVKDKLDKVRANLAEAAQNCGRSPEEITLVAVSKRQPTDAVLQALEAGHFVFGENYVQEALEKQDEIQDERIRWHYIGGLQSNKAKHAAGRFEMIHSVDSEKLAGALSNKAAELGITQRILIQVNIAQEDQKYGVTVRDLPYLAESLLTMPGLELKGLMVMPPFDPDPETARPFFAGLREQRDKLHMEIGIPLPHLSMGMSNDYVQAVEEGATLVRIGTDIFGPRP